MKPNTHNITSINVNGNFISQIIAETFNKYFVSVVQYIQGNKHNVNALSNHENTISYPSRAFNQPFPTINLKCVSFKEIEDITKSLKIKIHMDMMKYQQKFLNQVFITFLLL
jgi:hypothetical protein